MESLNHVNTGKLEEVLRLYQALWKSYFEAAENIGEDACEEIEGQVIRFAEWVKSEMNTVENKIDWVANQLDELLGEFTSADVSDYTPMDFPLIVRKWIVLLLETLISTVNLNID